MILSSSETYAGAVAVSCGLAVGLDVMVKKASFLSAGTKTVLGRFVPFTAAGAAGVGECLILDSN